VSAIVRSLLVIPFLWLGVPAASAQQVTLIDRIVAVVNKEVVTLSELNEQVTSAERQLRRQGTPLPERSVLERQLLERLILQKAQLQLARDSGIRVDEIQLDRAVQRIAENNKMTLVGFRRALEADGVDFERFREEVREQILLTRLREREIDGRIQVSDSEVDLYLEELKASGSERVEYNIAHILVRVPEQARPDQIEQARERARKARAEALAGHDFGKLAATYSDGPDALRGGAVGWRERDRLPELFTAALDKMTPGAVSEVLRSPAGFHVLKLVDRRAAGSTSAPVVQTHARHILVRTSEIVSEADARRRLSELRERIVRGGEDFAELAKRYSEDGTAARGGDLDWVHPGDTVPEFERAMSALAPGEVSQPIKTPFGWHLIQVLARRTADLSVERKRLNARQVLRARKADEAYQEWLRQLRDRTYVEVRLAER